MTGATKMGIVADNYKLDKFKEELTAQGFADFTITPFSVNTSTISILVSPDKVNEIRKICEGVEIHFKRSN